MYELENIMPDYIKQEIDEYVADVKRGKNRSSKWMNIRVLLRVAKLNNKLTEEQILEIEKKYKRE